MLDYIDADYRGELQTCRLTIYRIRATYLPRFWWSCVVTYRVAHACRLVWPPILGHRNGLCTIQTGL